MDRLLGAMAVFVEYPIAAAAIGILLLGSGRWTRRPVVVGVGVVWLLYGCYEIGMKQRWLCAGECNIRIDLLVIYPALVLGLVAAGVSLGRAAAGTRRSY